MARFRGDNSTPLYPASSSLFITHVTTSGLGPFAFTHNAHIAPSLSSWIMTTFGSCYTSSLDDRKLLSMLLVIPKLYVSDYAVVQA